MVLRRWPLRPWHLASHAYRYIDEVIGVLADEAPDLCQALEQIRHEGLPHVILVRRLQYQTIAQRSGHNDGSL